MNWLMNNWYLLVAAFSIVALCVVSIRYFMDLPNDVKIANFKEWLKWAVAQAEKELGGGTGQLKLRMVYQMAINSFSWIKDVLTFEAFSQLVDEALEWLNKQLESNEAVKKIILKEEER